MEKMNKILQKYYLKKGLKIRKFRLLMYKLKKSG